ncbi:MFS transporter [Streptomonospora sp. PA3]|uniref:MFS transporter n=1 Tax=Streptomonospora sp. PA3 TaxID=2607326 RepID=UPI0012DD512B|nr:MFS transporter [Streptomonospora sp. PA3]MUL41062.1 MFS transporter [Streptomonospora sp. PA3]
MSTDSTQLSQNEAKGQRLPKAALLALSTAVFITVLTETLPAGVLPQMSADIGVSESAMGQVVTIYAIGTALTAIPLSAATAGWRRKRLLLTAMGGFALANTVTAFSGDYLLIMVARFVAGVAAGLAWAMLVGYARRLAPDHLQGKAIALVMAGIPVALSLGVPAGTFIGTYVGWRVTFTLMSLLALVVIGWILLLAPERSGQHPEGRTSVLRALTIPGVVPVLIVTLVFVLAHTILYTYIATFLDGVGMGKAVGFALLLFGGASLVSIWFVGNFIDRRLRALTIASVILVAVAAAMLAVLAGIPALVYVAVLLWGLGWGGVPTLLQTAATDAGGDPAQAMLVTLWNGAMAGGGVIGGILLDMLGTTSFPWSVLLLLVPVLVVVVAARSHGFPVKYPTSTS